MLYLCHFCSSRGFNSKILIIYTFMVNSFRVPLFEIPGYTFNSVNGISFYYLILAICFPIYVIVYKVINSSIGLAFQALHEAKHFAKCLGANDYKYKLIAFGISTFLTGLIGALYAYYKGFVSRKI